MAGSRLKRYFMSLLKSMYNNKKDASGLQLRRRENKK
jgi:hypothetical protein